MDQYEATLTHPAFDLDDADTFPRKVGCRANDEDQAREILARDNPGYEFHSGPTLVPDED